MQLGGASPIPLGGGGQLPLWGVFDSFEKKEKTVKLD